MIQNIPPIQLYANPNLMHLFLQQHCTTVKRQPTKYERSPAEILQIVASSLHLTPEKILTKGRRTNIVFARQIAMKLIKDYTGMSLNEIGRIMSNSTPFDHTSVLHSISVVENFISIDPEYAETYYNIEQSVRRIPKNIVK